MPWRMDCMDNIEYIDDEISHREQYLWMKAVLVAGLVFLALNSCPSRRVPGLTHSLKWIVRGYDVECRTCPETWETNHQNLHLPRRMFIQIRERGERAKPQAYSDAGFNNVSQDLWNSMVLKLYYCIQKNLLVQSIFDSRSIPVNP